ncbi:hypothetical protein VFPFJ_01064 [Purpureocillium lilacinum]|uniref:Uncharacterized protein n=1 Tax=Purpureocillium lilacinum TaxID=33203 RepID=A0A179HWR8_PURLI|nr:hypothetical protein VFPFJ_01064 [Purpureocillium lilacinum]OAQ94955.1 hypothetical protein VFPFJ_01064 [Purpureocillium lilacinum]
MDPSPCLFACLSGFNACVVLERRCGPSPDTTPHHTPRHNDTTRHDTIGSRRPYGAPYVGCQDSGRPLSLPLGFAVLSPQTAVKP